MISTISLVLLFAHAVLCFEQKYIVLFKPPQYGLINTLERVETHFDFLSSKNVKDVRYFEFGFDNDQSETLDNSEYFQLMGYVATMDVETLEHVLSDSVVDHVEEDSIVYAFDKKHKRATQNDAPWGIVRTAHRERPAIDDTTFTYDERDGKDVNIYIIDTGIMTDHSDFGNRATWGATFVGDDTDENGHGTHCAGISAGTKYGICKSCNLVAVKVLDKNGSGSLSDVIMGMEWVVNEHIRSKKHKRSVVNMSLGGSFSLALNRAADAAVEAGVHFVVAAGNERSDSCMTSPASSKSVLAVGATDIHDNMAMFSNYGPCMSIWAPGVGIESDWIGNSKESTNVLSGTSMASPHVAGAVGALLSRKEHWNKTPRQMIKFLAQKSTKGVVQNIPQDVSSVNHMLFTGEDSKKGFFRIQTV